VKPWPEAEPSPSQPWAGAKGTDRCKSKPGPTEAEPGPGLLSRAGPCTSLIIDSLARPRFPLTAASYRRCRCLIPPLSLPRTAVVARHRLSPCCCRSPALLTPRRCFHRRRLATSSPRCRRQRTNMKNPSNPVVSTGQDVRYGWLKPTVQ